MHSLFIVLAALLLAVSANAGILWEVETESTTPIVGGVVITTVAQSNGSATINSGTWGGGSAFAGTTTIMPPTSHPISTVTIKLGNYSALTVTGGGAVIGGTQSRTVCAFLFNFCAISFSTNTGAAGTVTAGAYGIGVTYMGQQWTTGVAVASGLTSLGNPLPNVTTTGSFDLSPNGIGTIQLVVANKLAISGPPYGLQSTTATPTTLRLQFGESEFPDPPEVPEPSTLLLLGSGVLGLILAGRRRSQAR